MKYKEWKKNKFYTYRGFKWNKFNRRRQKRCRNCLGDSFSVIVKSKFIHWYKYHRELKIK